MKKLFKPDKEKTNYNDSYFDGKERIYYKLIRVETEEQEAEAKKAGYAEGLPKAAKPKPKAKPKAKKVAAKKVEPEKVETDGENTENS